MVNLTVSIGMLYTRISFRAILFLQGSIKQNQATFEMALLCSFRKQYSLYSDAGQTKSPASHGKLG